MPPVSAARSLPSTLRTRTASSAPELAQGDFGASVTELQRQLQRAGVPTGPIDGDFGPMTQAAVRRFQSSRGLPVDGVVGAATWAALRSGSTQRPGPTASGAGELRQGDLGGEVEDLQRGLLRHGFDPGDVDGQFGPNTRSALVQFQRAKGLNADGVAGESTLRALAGAVTPRPEVSGDLRTRILEAARAELGTTESGSNRGEALKYPTFFGRGAEPWCADFVSYVMRQSGGRMNDPYCPSIVNQLKRDGNWKGRSNPQPGDMVLFDWDGDREADHIGIVERVNGDGTISTIEGNTENPQTGREGVWRRTRSMGTILGFGAPY